MKCIARNRRGHEPHLDNFTVEALAAVLPQAWVQEAVAQSGCSSRRRRLLPAVLTVWLVTLLGLYRRLSYVNLLELLFESGVNQGLWHDAPPCSSPLCQHL